ncbi:MAG TPA: hypothetical protein VMT59_09515 [Gaiellaceae bacterium]|nr:hypothetical protein [Gaiellaceae bacterium]
MLAVLATLVTSAGVFANFAEGLENNHGALLIDMIDYQASRPFVARTLLPTAVRAIAAVTRTPVERLLGRRGGEPSPEEGQPPAGERRSGLTAMKHLLAAHPAETAAALGLMYGCLVGFAYLAARLFAIYYESPPAVARLLPALAPLGVPLFYFPGKWSYPYDLSSLFLTTLCLLFLAQRRWLPYAIAFTLACLNKETAVFLVPVFWVFHRLDGRLDEGQLTSRTALQLAIFAATKLALGALFRNNPGPYMEFHLFDHNLWTTLAWLRGGYGLTGLVVTALPVLCILDGWSEKPLLFRSGLVMLPPMLLLGFAFGWFEEWRQYLECYPILLMLILGSVTRAFGTRRRAEDAALDSAGRVAAA